MRVLIVDDHEVSIKLIDTILKQSFEGMSIDSARNGEAAVVLAHHFEYNLILMDINMPVMDGIKASQLIKQKRLGQSIIAVTASNIEEISNHLVEELFDSVVEKPLKINLFLEALQPYFSNS